VDWEHHRLGVVFPGSWNARTFLAERWLYESEIRLIQLIEILQQMGWQAETDPDLTLGIRFTQPDQMHQFLVWHQLSV